jgi:hypothetical protein
MPRMNEWQQDIHDGLRKEAWSLGGMNMIVKVVPGGGAPASQKGGYITLGKFLLGKTPQQIERDLGLPLGYLGHGARIYRFTRLPLQHEYEYELTADHPGGLKYNPAHLDPRYEPGSRKIHQWEIKRGVQIPVDQRNFVELKAGQQFPYGWLERP